jgi:glycosyltransferase involved in cell wall biosynthesis
MNCKSSKKVILAVTNDMLTDQRVDRIARTLVQAGLDVTVVGRLRPNSILLDVRPYQVVRLKLLFDKGMMFYASYNVRLFFYLLFHRTNGITANDLDTLVACRLAAWLKRIPIIYDSHEYFTEVPELVQRPRVKRCWAFLENIFIQRINCASTVCQSIANVYQQKYGITMSVIRNVPYFKKPYQAETVDVQLPENKKIIIYQGALNLGRGIEKAILATKFSDKIFLVIAGDGDITQQLKALVADNNLIDRVLFTGRIPLIQLNSITQKADLGISLEENLGLNYYFSLPNKLFDYIQNNIPVICSNFPETSAIIQKYNIGLNTNESDPEKLARIFESVLLNDELYRNMKQNLQVAANELNWEKEKDILIQLYKKAGLL